MLDQMHSSNKSAGSYATASDFINTFAEEMDSLYLLSLLLTADKRKAEQCFVCAMEACVEGIGVFEGWASSSTRHAVLKSAIRIVMPVPERADSVSILSFKEPATSTENGPFAAILSLDTFERFVFVISILEGRTELECAVLLGCSRQDVTIARLLALKRLAKSDAAHSQAEEFAQA